MILRSKARALQAGGTFALAVCLTGIGVGAGSVTAADTPTPTASTSEASTGDAKATTVKIGLPADKSKYKEGQAVPLSGYVNANDKFGGLGLAIDYSGSAEYDKVWVGETSGAAALINKYTQDIGATPQTAVSYFAEKPYTIGPSNDAATVKGYLPDTTKEIPETDYTDPKGVHHKVSWPVIPGVGQKKDVEAKLGPLQQENCNLAVEELKEKFANTPGHKDFWVITDGGCSSAANTAKSLGEDYTVNVINTNETFVNDGGQGCGPNTPSGAWAAMNGGICKTITDPQAIAAEVQKIETRAKTISVTVTGDNGYTTTQDVSASQLIDGSWKGTDLTGLKVGNYTAKVTADFTDGSQRTDSTTFSIEAEATPEPTPTTSTPEPSTSTPAPTTSTPEPTTSTPAPTTSTPAPVEKPVVVGPVIQTDYVR